MKIESILLLIPLFMVCFGAICVWYYVENSTVNYITTTFNIEKNTKYIGPNIEYVGETACYRIKQIHEIEIRDDRLFVTATAKYKVKKI